MNRRALLLVACPLLITLAACSGNKEDNPPPKNGGGQLPKNDLKTASGQEPAENDTLLLYYGDDPDTLNYLTSSDNVSTAFQRLVYEPLAERKMDDPQVWLPKLAESWEFNPDDLTYDIKLREGVMWHPITLPNGKELPAKEFTSRDVEFTFDCIFNESIEAASIRSYYEDPEATDPANKYKMKVS